MSRIIEQLPALTQLFLEDRKYGHLTLTWKQISILKNAMSALSGFPVLTDLLSAEKQVTISSVVPLLEHIYSLCQTVRIEEDKTDEDEVALSNSIRSKIKDYVAGRYHQANAQDGCTRLFLRVAEFLDPRYVQQAANREVQVDDRWIKWPDAEEVKQEIARLAVDVDDSLGSEQDCETLVVNEVKNSSSFSLVSLLKSNHSEATSTPKLTKLERASKELDFYLLSNATEDCDVLNWWKCHTVEYPLLSKLARKILTSNASSVASERLFSLAANIVTKKRNNLKPSTVDMLAFLAFNR